MTKHTDLQNDGLPVEVRLKHLEQEAAFVRDHVARQGGYALVALALSVLSLALSVVALLK